jgi:hypothetical protein
MISNPMLIFAAMKLRWLFGTCLVLTLISGISFAQGLNHPRDIFPALRQSPKLLIGLDSRRSIISSRDVQIMGLRASLDFESRIRLGFGVYFLASKFERLFLIPDQLGNVNSVHSRLKFTYMSAYFEYVLFSNKHWEFSTPIHLGIGDVGFTIVDQEPQTVLLTEMNLVGSYKILPFIGLAGGFGYRLLLAGGETIREKFNAPTYSFGLKLWMGYLFDKYIKKKKPPTSSMP